MSGNVTASQAVFCTPLGEFQADLFTEKAPVTAAYFQRLIALKALDNSSVYRIVSTENNAHNPTCPINVIQAGLRFDDPQPVPPIPHEDTQTTGLSHLKWCLSTARFAAGETYASFFICMRDEPALDYAGKRHVDGLGFAVFGRVSAGFDVVEKLYNRREIAEFLQQPIAITRAFLK